MGRKKDPFWEHVEQLENKRFLCIYCQHDFAGSISITRIKYHLSGIRNHDAEICLEVPKDVQEKAYQAIEDSNKRGKSMACSNNAEEIETVVTPLPSSSKGLHQSITSKVHKKDKSEVDEIIAKFIMSSEIKFGVIQNPFFVNLLNSIAEFGPSYKLPRFSTLKYEIIPKIREEVDKYTENIKKSAFSTGFTVTFQIKPDPVQFYDMVNIFVYALSGAMLIGYDLLVEVIHAFVEDVCSTVNSFGHGDVVQFIITDDLPTGICGDTDDKSTEDMLIEKYPSAYVTGCVAEKIQSLLETIYQEVPCVSKTIHLAYVIGKYLHKHNTDLSLGKEQLRSKNYGSYYFNQVASKFLMLTSILKVERELQTSQLSIASPSCEGHVPALTKEIAKVVDNAIHSEDFWSRGKEVVRLLQPLFRVLRLVDGNGPTSGYLYEAMRRAENEIKQNRGINQVHYEMIEKIFTSRRSHIIRPIHTAAAFLNPAYMLSQNFTVDNEMEEGINYMSKHFIPAHAEENFMNQVQLYRTEDRKLFNATSVRLLETCHPGIWWKNCGGHLFELRESASKILSQPCSSSLCNTGDLPPELEEEDYDRNCRINLMMMEKFSMLGKQELEPIDLDKIIGLPEYAPENSPADSGDEFEGPWPWEDYWDLLKINDPTL